MKYEDLVATHIQDPQDYKKAFNLLSHEFTEHEHTDLNFYDYVILVKYKNEGVGVITGMRHLPSKAIITDIVVDKQYRGQAIGLKLLTVFTQKVKSDGFSYVMGITEPHNRAATNLYKKLGATQEQLTVTISEIDKQLQVLAHKEMVLKERQKRREKE
tara:strand:- start:548 stop:1021 length:474 start_codon:yes stop_codon:yes gene_type:complete